MSIRFFCPFLNWIVWFLLVSCVSSSYISDIGPLASISLAKISSHSVSRLFTLLIVSFALRKRVWGVGPIVLFLLRVHFGVACRRPLPGPTSASFSLFSSRRPTLSGLLG